MGRNSVLCNLLAMALLVATPVLCIGGLISHPCECGDEIGCGHETDCASDPCNFVLPRGDAPNRAEISQPTVTPFTAAALTFTEVLGCFLPTPSQFGDPPDPQRRNAIATTVLLI